MDSVHGKMRMNLEGDRLSSLPDDLIHKILSSFNIKSVIQISVLSSRWRFIWTSMPYLNFSIEGFSTLPKFSKFVSSVLCRRNYLTDVYSMTLKIRVKESLLFLKRVLDYAFSHNIQQLDVVCLLEKAIKLPLSLLSSRSLKHLSIIMQFDRTRRSHFDSCFVSTWELPTLTTLDLHYVALRNADKCIDVFSKCANLKNLTLKHFSIVESNGLSISHPRLSNLTLEEDNLHDGVTVDIDAPQLKNLNIRSCTAIFVISAPVLASLLYKGYRPLDLSTNGFHTLEKADICFLRPNVIYGDAHRIVRLLELIQNVKFLTLNLGIVELLSSVDIILRQPSPFFNLKSLKIYPETVRSWGQAPKKVTVMSMKVKSYLLDSSPGSTLTMILREEIQARKLMAELRVCLEKEKDNSKTYKAHLERGKTPVESHEPKKLEITRNMVQIKSGWEDLAVQLQQSKEKACLIISKVQCIKELLTKLPASNRAKIQPSFSSLCAEVDIAIRMITDCMKIRCDENQCHSSVCFQELATTLEPSS